MAVGRPLPHNQGSLRPSLRAGGLGAHATDLDRRRRGAGLRDARASVRSDLCAQSRSRDSAPPSRTARAPILNESPGTSAASWTFARNTMLYSREAVAWPRNGGSARFDASFSTSTPEGAAPSTVQFSGGVFHPDGGQLPPGTQVEAYVRGTRCGIASTRRTGNFSGYILAV